MTILLVFILQGFSMLRRLATHFHRFASLPPHSTVPSHLLHTTPQAKMELQEVVSVLERLAPTKAAESWDNVGLLLEPSNPRPVKRVFVTNDLTEPVMEEVLSSPGERAGLVISYHPPIFKPLKALTQQCAKERVLVRALEGGVAVYSPHTSLDNMEGGINDWLLSAVGEGEVRALGVQKHAADRPNVLTLEGGADEISEQAQVLSQQNGVCVQLSKDGSR